MRTGALLTLIELPIREVLLRLIRPAELDVEDFAAVETDGFLTLIELPIREVLLRLIRPAELAAGDFGAVETEGFLTLMELPIREVLLRLIRLAELAADGFVAVETDGFLTLMELPIREVLLRLIRLAELDVDGFVAVETDGFLTLMELPIREVLLELIRLAELAADDFAAVETDGFLTLMELPIREVLLVLLRMLVLGAVGLLLLKELTDGLRALEVILDRRVAGRLGVDLLGGLLRVILLGRRVLGLTIVLLGLLRTEGFETLRLAGALVERAGALTLELLLLTDEGREVLGAEELFVTARLFWLPPLDLLLLRPFFAVTGSASNIKAEIIVNRITLTFVEFFRVNIACLLNLNLSYNTHIQTSVQCFCSIH